jgi:ABC-type transporter Mla subunit MlaD
MTDDAESDDLYPTGTSPVTLFARSQEQAVKVATDTLQKIRSMAGSAGSQLSPDAMMQQVAELSGAVTNLAGSASGLAGAIAAPLQDVIVEQRRLAEVIAKFAEAQSELADIVAEFAQRQAATVAAVERITDPVFGFVGAKQSEKKSATKAAEKKKK